MTLKSQTQRSSPKRRVRLKLRLHPGQREVHDSPARFKVVACGRQWGKSKYASAWAFERALVGKAGWWVAPDANVAAIGWRLLKGLAFQVPGVEVREAERILRFPSGGWLQVKGAHNEGRLRGVTLDFLVVDEAAFITSGERWTSELRPTLAVKNGEALFVSTFDGENWFYDLYEHGHSDDPEWESWRKPSTENPYFPPGEIERARAAKMPEPQIQQEYFANPLIYVGAVFPGEMVQASVDRGKHPETWEEYQSYAGLDWGHNTTAFQVCQEHPTLDEVRWVEEGDWHVMPLGPDPYKERITKIDLIVDACHRHDISGIYADAAGATENAALEAALEDEGLKTELVSVPFGKYKEGAITARRWYLERGLESMSPECPELIRTTKRYRYKEGTEDILKEDDHHVDASLAFYASRRPVLVGE